MNLNHLSKDLRSRAISLSGKVGVAATGLMAAGMAAASEPTGAAAAFTELSASITEYEGYAWPVVTAITLAVIGIKLFKKFANKAT